MAYSSYERRLLIRTESVLDSHHASIVMVFRPCIIDVQVFPKVPKKLLKASQESKVHVS